MTLVPNWRAVLRRAWSFRLMVAAGLLSGAEMVLPLVSDSIPRGPLVALSLAVTVAATVARFVAQRNVSGDPR